MPEWKPMALKSKADSGSLPGTRGSWIVYCPELCPGRYVHFSWLNASFKLRNFIDGQVMEQDHDWDAQKVWNHCKDKLKADRVPIEDDAFWTQRLTEITRQKLGKV